MSIVITAGPSTDAVSKDEAVRKLINSPGFPKDAEVEVTAIEGRWVAGVRVAGPPPFGGGGPADSDEKAPGPKSEGPDDAEPSEDGGADEGPPTDEEGGPPKEEGKEKGGEKHELTLIHDLLTKIMIALGIPDSPEDSALPGEEGPPAPPEAGPPGPPHGAEDSVKHERALKPGEAPVGTTPVGAPAFASTHPWAEALGRTASFELGERIPEDLPMSEVDRELQVLAAACPEVNGRKFKVKQIASDYNEQGHRIARALISVH